jgi:probable phosphomutase (TIGR03848 family)
MKQMTEIYLIRHGRSVANTKGILAGRLPKIELDEIGVAQARALAQNLASVDIADIFSSPLERCMATAAIILEQNPKIKKMQVADEFIECDYGKWSGKKISKLSLLPLWKVIQSTPSQATFPDGESMMQMSSRAVGGLMTLLNTKKPPKNIAIVSHADVIKALIAFAMGLHLDNFQKLIIDPASISKLKWQKNNFYVDSINQKSHLAQIKSESKAPSGAVLGGGAG